MAYFGAYPWWTEEQVEFQKKTAAFLDTLVEEEMVAVANGVYQ